MRRGWPSRPHLSRVSFGGLRAAWLEPHTEKEGQPCLTLARTLLRGQPASGSPWMCTATRSRPACCRPRAGRSSFSSSRTARRRSVGLIGRLGGPEGLAVCYEAGPCGYDLYRLLVSMGVACDIVAPSLIPVRPGDRVKTDRRDAASWRGCTGRASSRSCGRRRPEQEGLRDLVRCRDDLRRRPHRRAPPGRGSSCLRYGHIYREGKKAWTLRHRAWVRRQRLDDPLAQAALEHMLCHLETLEAQLAAVDRQLERVAGSQPWCDPVRWLHLLPRHLDADRARAARRDRRLPPLRHRPRADELPRPDRRRVLLRRPARPRRGSPRPATGTPAVSWSRPPGTTGTRRDSRLASARTSRSSRPKRTPAPGKRRSASTNATATSPATASSRPSPPPPSPANSAASSGPP